MTIVRTSYRYKRPPRKQKEVALGVPVIVTKDTLRQGPDGQREPRQWRDRPLRDILVRMRHNGCSGRSDRRS